MEYKKIVRTVILMIGFALTNLALMDMVESSSYAEQVLITGTSRNCFLAIAFLLFYIQFFYSDHREKARYAKYVFLNLGVMLILFYRNEYLHYSGVLLSISCLVLLHFEQPTDREQHK